MYRFRRVVARPSILSSTWWTSHSPPSSINRIHTSSITTPSSLSSLTTNDRYHRYYFNDSNQTKTKSNTENDKPGLFSITGLHEPTDFIKLAHNAIHTCNDLRQQIHNSLQHSSSSSSRLSPRETLYILDSISNTICSIIDASELCRCVHKSPKWRQAASSAYTILSDYIADLNTDETLYASLPPITSNANIMNNELEEEERRMAILLQKEYERDGIHLSKEKRGDVKDLHGFITQLETMFSENLVKNEVYDVYNDNSNGDGGFSVNFSAKAAKKLSVKL